MDNRKALFSESILSFPGMDCSIEAEIGRGSNAIVYKGTYPDSLHHDEKHTVLIKELFPYHAKAAIYRDEQNEIKWTEEGRETFDIHRQSFEYGNRIHLRMLQMRPDLNGANLNTFIKNNTLYTVLGYTGGRSLECELETVQSSLTLLTTRMLGLLDALEAFHENGFLHLDISPDNILLIGQGTREQIILIDYNSVYDKSSFHQNPPVYYSIKSGYTAPEVRSGNSHSIGPASDLYSVTAVFYRCLTGTILTPFQMIRPVPPDVSGCPYLKDMPDTVRSMVQQILFRGLQTLPQKRYSCTSEMRESLQELWDRIKGVGITHWSLWEAGRKTVARVIKDNPSFAFLKNDDKLFPANAVDADGNIKPIQEYIYNMSSESGKNLLLVASGGMGKTTSMLRAMSEQPAHYSPIHPAITYISLYGWKEGCTTYIRDRILENLHYKADTQSYEDARHALYELMEKPIITRTGKRPVLILFLDGLNETSGFTQALTEEIIELSHLDGVRILVSSRSDSSPLPFTRIHLSMMTEKDVSNILSEQGLLLPESLQMRELLRTPLLLSVFLQTSLAEQKQLTVQTQYDLMQTYFSSIMKKELRDLPEDTDMRWQIDVAISYVLPSIAEELQRKQKALSDTELLAVVERCYGLLSSPILRRSFPAWIGHSRAIKGNASNSEEWYGIIIHELLWKRLGLIVKNVDGNYQIVHQIIGEYLCNLNLQIRKKIRRQQNIRVSIATGMFLLLIMVSSLVYTIYIAPPSYNEAYADTVFALGYNAYSNAGRQYEYLYNLITCAINEPDQYEEALDLYFHQVEYASLNDFSIDAERMLDKMLETGKVMPWSKKELNKTYYVMLIHLMSERLEEYETLVNVLTHTMNDKDIDQLYGDAFRELFSQLIEEDANIAATLYQIVCMPHVVGKYSGDTPDAENLKAVMKLIYLQNEHLSNEENVRVLEQNLNTLMGKRVTIINKIYANGAYSVYQRINKKE